MIFPETQQEILIGTADSVLFSVEAIPLLPVRIALFALVLISVVSWAIIIGKALLFQDINRSDRRFKNSLRKSKSCLEVLESGESFEPSPLFDVYDEGARAAAVEIVGSGNPRFLAEHKMETRGNLTAGQFRIIEDAFGYGEKFGMSRLKSGFPTLQAISVFVPILGIAVSAIILISSIGLTSAEFRENLFAAFLLVAASLFVSAPAGIARVHFLAKCRSRAKMINRFKKQLSQAFEQEFVVTGKVNEIKPIEIDLPGNNEMTLFQPIEEQIPQVASQPKKCQPKQDAVANPDHPYVPANY